MEKNEYNPLDQNEELKGDIKKFIKSVCDKTFTKEDILQFCNSLIYKSNYFKELAFPKKVFERENNAQIDEKGNSSVSLGGYRYASDAIGINLDYYYTVLQEDPTQIAGLIDTVGHEMTHAEQHVASDVFCLNQTLRNNGKIGITRRLSKGYLDFDKLEQLLEVSLSIDGSNKEEVNHSKKISEKIAKLMKESNITELKKEIEFGAYLNEEYELDARKGGAMFSYIMCEALKNSKDKVSTEESALYEKMFNLAKEQYEYKGFGPHTKKDNQAYKKLVKEAKKLTLEQFRKIERSLGRIAFYAETYAFLLDIAFQDLDGEKLCDVIKYSLDNNLDHMLECVIDIYQYNCLGNEQTDARLSKIIMDKLVAQDENKFGKEKSISVLLCACSELLKPEDAKIVMKTLCDGNYNVEDVFGGVLDLAEGYLKKENSGGVLDGMSKYDIVKAVLRGDGKQKENDYLQENMNTLYQMLSYNHNFIKNFTQMIGEACVEKCNSSSNFIDASVLMEARYPEVLAKLDDIFGDETPVYRDTAKKLEEKSNNLEL